MTLSSETLTGGLKLVLLSLPRVSPMVNLLRFINYRTPLSSPDIGSSAMASTHSYRESLMVQDSQDSLVRLVHSLQNAAKWRM